MVYAPPDSLVVSLLYLRVSCVCCNTDQGENNCETAYVGNVLNGSGYGCELPAMVADWRSVWSATSGTTAPLAPFGIATLAAGGSEGHSGAMAAMRWSQTANYGHFDNPALPATFGAQLYDLGDPWAHSGTGDGNTLQVRSFTSTLLLSQSFKMRVHWGNNPLDDSSQSLAYNDRGALERTPAPNAALRPDSYLTSIKCCAVR